MILFKPTGSLDVNTDPAQLPEEQGMSGAMQRCKNLRLDSNGVAKTRYGSSKINAVALPVAIGHITEQSGDRYSFGTSIYKNESSIGSGFDNKDWSSIQYSPFNSSNENVFALNGTDRKRIQNGVIYDWGIDAPTQALTLSVGSSTGLTGTYNAKITFARLEGSVIVCESDAGDAGTAVALTNDTLKIGFNYDAFSDLDPQITHIIIYRTLAGGNLYYKDKEIPVSVVGIRDYSFTADWEESEGYIAGTGYNIAEYDSGDDVYAIFSWEDTYDSDADIDDYSVSTSYEVEPLYIETSTADGLLGTALHTNHDRPPTGTVVLGPNFDGYSFILKDNLCYFSLPKQPEYWPLAYYVEAASAQFELTAGCFYNGSLYVATKHKLYNITGTGAETFFPVPQSTITGAQGRYGIYGMDGAGIWHVGSDGVYLFSASGDQKVTALALDRIFKGETVNGVPGAGSLSSAWIVQHHNKLYFAYAGTADTYPQNVFVIDLESKKITYYDWGIEIPCACVDNTNDRLLVVDSSGYVWHVEDSTKTADESTAISWEIESKDFTLTTRAHFPRWVKYDVNAEDAATAYGYVILDGATHQTHTLSTNRKTKRRLVDVGNGNRCSLRLSGSGAVEIYAVESE